MASEAKASDVTEHEFSALNMLLFCFMMALCVIAGYLLKKYKFYYLPESAAVMAIGAVLGGIVKAASQSQEEMSFLAFNPELFFFVLLPPIIFEAGYTLNKKGFFSNFTTILLYAVVGTLISTMVVGMFMYGLAAARWIEMQNHTPLEALLFGALISAVDPVATLAIMGAKEINCDPLLYSLIFGESVLNDAVAIVLFRTIQGFVPKPGETAQVFGFSTVLNVLWQFLIVSIGSVVVGVACGLLCSLTFKQTKLSKYPKYEITCLLLCAFGSYAVAEAISLSGIMALFFCGITLSHYNFYNLSESSQISSTYVFEAVASLSETIVFAYLGTTLFSGLHLWDVGMILFALFACLLGRALNTFPLSWFANLKRKTPVPWNMQVVIWFAGLRGAVAFALSMTLQTPNRRYIIATTLIIVVFTTFVCGGLTEPVLGKMGMKRSIRRGSSNDVSHQLLGSPGDETGTIRTDGISVALPPARKTRGGFHGWFKSLDTNYIKPLFGGSKPGNKSNRADRNRAGSSDNLFDERTQNSSATDVDMREIPAGGGQGPYAPPDSPNGRMTLDDAVGAI
jgi:solute carrier family 9 (sodium/hydrogen exchanger), member 8